MTVYNGTITVGDLSGIVYGYARDGNIAGSPSFGSASIDSGAPTLDILYWYSGGSSVGILFPGNVPGSVFLNGQEYPLTYDAGNDWSSYQDVGLGGPYPTSGTVNFTYDDGGGGPPVDPPGEDAEAGGHTPSIYISRKREPEGPDQREGVRAAINDALVEALGLNKPPPTVFIPTVNPDPMGAVLNRVAQAQMAVQAAMDQEDAEVLRMDEEMDREAVMQVFRAIGVVQ